MKKITEYFRFILFACGVLVGIQVPGFVDQYGKSLESHFIESSLGLKEFQKDADKYFSGDLQKLIYHYQENPDQVFNAGGDSIDAIYQRNQLLETATLKYKSGLVNAYSHVLVKPIPEIRDEVWSSYTYGIILDKFSVMFGLSFGLLFSMLIGFVLVSLKLFSRILFRPKTINTTI